MILNQTSISNPLSKIFLRLLILIPAWVSLALAQESPPTKPESPPATNAATAEPVKPSVIKLDDTRFQIGEVILDRKSREIRFPTKVNMSEGLIEYLIVLQQGKAHESLLITAISPTHLNLAFTLLRYAPSRELFSLIDETGHPTGMYPDVSTPVKAAARIAVDVEWSDNGTIRRIPVNEWFRNTAKDTVMAAGPWLYTGSGFSENKFIPELTGDIAAIMTDSNAVINYPGSDNQDNVIWYAFPKRVPPVGTTVTLIIAPYPATQPLSKP